MKQWLTAAICATGVLAGDALAAETHANTDSLYTLSVKLVDQHGQQKSLDLYRGHPVVVTMFYATCPNACPLLIESLRATEAALGAKTRSEVRVLMVTIDPERDTTIALAALAKERRIDSSRWTIARMTDEEVRLLAAALDIQYRRLPNGEFNHTSVLTLISKEGAIGAQTSKLGKADPAFIAAVEAAAKAPR